MSVGQYAGVFHGSGVFVEVGRAVAIPVGEVVGGATQETEELVEAVRVRSDARIEPGDATCPADRVT